MRTHCCEMMTSNVQHECAQHPDPADCPDALIGYSLTFDEYGIWIHDGGPSYVVISFCPWCGQRLPSSRRDEWFDTLERLGFDCPLEQDIPPEFKTDAWYGAGVRQVAAADERRPPYAGTNIANRGVTRCMPPEHLFLVGEFPERARLLSGLTFEQVTLCPHGASHSIYEELWHVVSRWSRA